MATIDDVRDAADANDFDKALRIASKINLRAPYADPIRKAYSAKIHPEFYASIGGDAAAIREAGIRAVKELVSNGDT